jgi:hypothetical protein
VILISIVLSCAPKYQIKNIDKQKQLPQSTSFVEISDKISTTVDKDKNGRPDIWSYRETEDSPISIRALDLNQDGKQDLRTYYDNNGSITREEIDGDFDGIVDIIDYYTNNQRTESQIDTNSDSTFDVFRFYDQDTLKREELDINYDNQIDLTYNYDNDGNRIKE